MKCPLCKKRKVAKGDDICCTCRNFIEEYIATGRIIKQAVPAVADVLLVMAKLGVDQDRAVTLFGGIP